MGEVKPKEPLLAVLLSFVFTGLGHIYAERTKRGVALLSASLVASIIAIVYYLQPSTRIYSVLQASAGRWATLPYYNQGTYGEKGRVVTVPADHYFVLGDNSTSSHDSRFWGCVSSANWSLRCRPRNTTRGWMR